MIVTIYRAGAKVCDVKPEDSSELLQVKQQTDTITLNFRRNEAVELYVGDYIIYDKRGISTGAAIPASVKYSLRKLPARTDAPSLYIYECTFEGEIHALDDTRCMLRTDKPDGTYYLDYKFPLTGNALKYQDFIIGTLNRNGGTYSAGLCKDTAIITAEFNSWTVTEALAYLSGELGFSWYLENGVLHFDEKQTSSATTFQLGRMSGLVSVKRERVQSKPVETVVYGYGSTDNVPPRTSSAGITFDSAALSENRLSFSGAGGESRLEANTAIYGRVESVQEFDIKPQFFGTVTAVGDVFTFYDANIAFDINSQLISGIPPKVYFNDGLCMGCTFNITFNNDLKQYILSELIDESGSKPSELIHPATGDSYTLIDITLPQSYITDAQARLRAATQAYLDKSSKPAEFYTAVLDDRYIRANGIVLSIGDFIRITVPSYALDGIFEIKELSQRITKPDDYSIKFGDILPINMLAQIKISNFTVNNAIYKSNRTQITSNSVTNIIGDTVSWSFLG